MLHNPNWDQPSLQGFRGWLLKQPQDGTFVYDNTTCCPVAQYMSTMGKTYNDGCDLLNKYAYRASCAAQNEWRKPTFGDVVKAIDHAMAEATA